MATRHVNLDPNAWLEIIADESGEFLAVNNGSEIVRAHFGAQPPTNDRDCLAWYPGGVISRTVTGKLFAKGNGDIGIAEG